MRELAGALNCLQTYQRLTGRHVGVGAARKVLGDLERDCIRIVRIADVEQAVCRLFGVEPDDLKSNRRTRSISQPRMLAMYLARKHTQAAYSEIGEYFGGRNHSTVMSAEKKISQWVSEQAEVRVASSVWSFGDLVESLEHQLLAG
jgi:chromosomal replication initiator protein